MNKLAKREEALTSMIKSCFTYGGADKDSWNYNRYITQYQKEFSEEDFNRIYEDTIKDLKENYQIKEYVYIDQEGCSYNELVKKEN